MVYKNNLWIIWKRLNFECHNTLQAREKFLSLRKGTRTDLASALEEVSTCLSCK